MQIDITKETDMPIFVDVVLRLLLFYEEIFSKLKRVLFTEQLHLPQGHKTTMKRSDTFDPQVLSNCWYYFYSISAKF